MVSRRLGFTARDLAGALAPTVLPLAVMAVAVLGVRQVFGAAAPPIVELVVLVLVGLAAYAGTGFVAHRATFIAAVGDARRLMSRKEKV